MSPQKACISVLSPSPSEWALFGNRVTAESSEGQQGLDALTALGFVLWSYLWLADAGSLFMSYELCKAGML